MIADDPKSSEILKPILRGRDIKRYRAQWAGLWLISTIPARNIEIDDYPAVKRHLLAFGRKKLEQNGTTLSDGTKSRKRTSHRWFELQDTCAYHAEFRKEKLFWIELADDGRFAFDDTDIYGDTTTFVMTGVSMKFLCAMLNATPIRWYLQRIAPTSGMGTLRWKKVYVETLPIPKVSSAQERPLVRLIDNVLSTGSRDATTGIDAVEAQIDQYVYGLYGMNPSEIDLVEQRYESSNS